MNMLYIEKKFCGILGQTLDQFKVKRDRPYLSTCRCPFCGDSQKNKLKTRGHFYETKNGHISFKCFNCAIAKTLPSVLFTVSPVLYKEYKLETLRDSGGIVETAKTLKETKTKKVITNNFVSGLKKISQLPTNHPAVVYCNKRKIPPSQHYRIYYVDKFFDWVNKNLIEDKFNEKALKLDSPRLVFLFRDRTGNVIGAQGRSLTATEPKFRYITVMKENHEKLFGLETLDINKKTYVVEGPIDSLFLSNCIAMAGSDAKFETHVDKNVTTVIMDNEPRNTEIVSRMNKYISDGWKVCIWPEDIQHKDINDMVLAGLEPQSIIDANTYEGLAAKLKLSTWRKCNDR